MSTLLEEQYIYKAQVAFKEENLKLCLVYLKKVTTWSTDLTTLLVESAYRLWKYNVAHATDDTIDNETSEIVRQAFTQLLSGVVPFHLIQAFDYIRLSHIYLVEGNLRGALEILNLASHRGHLEDTLIVAQTWSIIKRIEGMKKREITDRINFLVSAITLLAGSTKTGGLKEVIYIDNSPMPLSYVYLHATNHLSNLTKLRPKSILQGNQRQQQFRAMLVEAYYFSFGIKETNLEVISKWFFDPDTWHEMGRQLENTPFICFAEDCYWEAFLRAPLLEKSIQAQIESMIKYKRRDAVPMLLREAMIYNPWNVFCRQSLITWEETLQPDPSQREWTILFHSEMIELRKIQAHVRGWYLRRHWPERSIYYIELRAEFMRKMVLSYEYYDAAILRYQQSLYNKWRIYVKDWKLLKFESSRLIQTNFRRYLQTKRYSLALQRVQYANAQYLNALYFMKRNYRLHALHHWYHIFMEKKKKTAADIITAVFFLNGYNQLLVKGMTLITTLLRIHRKHEKKRLFKFWLFRYHHRRKVRAMNTIRFFIRYMIRRKAEAEVEVKLKEIEIVIAQKLEVQYERNKSSVLKPFWYQWRKAYLFNLRYRKVLLAVSTVQLKFLQRKAIKYVHELWLRKENQLALIKYRNHRLLLTIIDSWRKNGASFRITRFFHNTLAYRKYKRLLVIAKQMKTIKDQRELKIKENIWLRIEKYRFLWKRERLRAIKRLQKFFRFLKFKKHLRKLMKRKVFFYYHLIWKLHFHFLFQCYHNFHYRTIFKRRVQGINKFNHVFTRYLLFNGLKQWQRQTDHQAMMENIIEQRLMKKWNTHFFLQAYRTVRIIKDVTFTNMHEYQEKQKKLLLTSESPGKAMQIVTKNESEDHEGEEENDDEEEDSFQRNNHRLSPTSPTSASSISRISSPSSSPMRTPGKIISQRTHQRTPSPSSPTVRRVPSPSVYINSPQQHQHSFHQPSNHHIDIFTTPLAPWEEYSPSNKKILYSIKLMRMMKVFQYWTIQYRLHVRQVRLQSLLFSFQFQEYLLYRLYKRKQFVITIQSFFRQIAARKRLESYRLIAYKESEIQTKHLQLFQNHYFYEIQRLTRQRYEARIKLQCWIRSMFAKIEYNALRSMQEQYEYAINTIRSSFFYRNTIIRKVFQQFFNVFITSFMKNISNDDYIIHKDRIRKQKQRLFFKKHHHHHHSNSSSSPSKFSKKLRKSVKKAKNHRNKHHHQQTMDEDDEDDSLRFSDEEDEGDDRRRSNHYYNNNEDENEDDDEMISQQLSEFDEESDATLLRLEMLEKYQNKLNQRQSNDIKDSITASSPSNASAAHISQIKQLQRQKQKQQPSPLSINQTHQVYERKKTVHLIQERKLQLQQKFTPKSNNKASKTTSHLQPSQTMIYFQSRSFHDIYHRFQQSRFLALDDSMIESLYPQEVYYLIQQSNRVFISDVGSKKQLSFVSESFNGKQLFFMNGRLHESYFDRFVMDLLQRRRQNYGKVPFETNRWPLTLPLHMIEDEEEAAEEDEKERMRRGIGTGRGAVIDRGREEERLRGRKRKLLSLSMQSMSMSVYTMMKLCRHITRMNKNNDDRFSQSSSGLIVQDIEEGDEEKEEENLQEVMMYADVKDSKHALYRKVIYYGLRELTIDIASFGWLGYVLLLHSLQYCDGLNLLVIHEGDFYSSSVLRREDDARHLKNHRASVLAYAFACLGKNPSLTEIRYHGILDEAFLSQFIEIFRDPLKFSNLQKLSFSILKKNIALTEELIKMSKARAYSLHGKGISIMIDVADE